MPLIDNKGYDELQKNNTPAKPTVMVTLIAMAMAMALQLFLHLMAIAYSQKIVSILFRPIIRTLHLSLFCAAIATKKTPNVRHVLNPKGHAKTAF